MALNLASRLQVTAHYFWNRRNAAALSHHGVRLEYDPEQRRSAALILGFTLTLLAVALMFILSWFKPAGQVGASDVLADRDTGAVYVVVDGRLHPALNLTSARLISGQPNNPTFVKANELAKYAQGPTVGIVGAPASMPIRTGDGSAWAVCDTAPAATATTSAAAAPVVTAIAGPLTLGQRAQVLAMPRAILANYAGKTYVIWDGHRSEIDLSNKAVALALGVDSQAPEPIPFCASVRRGGATFGGRDVPVHRHRGIDWSGGKPMRKGCGLPLWSMTRCCAERSRRMTHTPLVARVWHLSDKQKPDHCAARRGPDRCRIGRVAPARLGRRGP